jgi:hypothetical protein
MSSGATRASTRLRVTPSRLLRAALGALLLAGLAAAIYPRLIEDGAASGLVFLAQGFVIAATALTFVLFVAAIILRLARQDEPSLR